MSHFKLGGSRLSERAAGTTSSWKSVAIENTAFIHEKKKCLGNPELQTKIRGDEHYTVLYDIKKF